MPWFKVWLRRHVGWDALAAQESVLDDCPGDRWMQQRLVKARPEIVPSREWHRVRGQNFQRHAFTSCGIPKHVDFGCCKFLLHGGPVHDDCCLCCQRYIRLKWLQGIYMYIYTHTYSVHMIWLSGKASAHMSEAMKLLPWGLQPWQKWLYSQLHWEKTKRFPIWVVTWGLYLCLIICLYFLWCGWCSCNPLQGNPWQSAILYSTSHKAQEMNALPSCWAVGRWKPKRRT